MELTDGHRRILERLLEAEARNRPIPLKKALQLWRGSGFWKDLVDKSYLSLPKDAVIVLPKGLSALDEQAEKDYTAALALAEEFEQGFTERELSYDDMTSVAKAVKNYALCVSAAQALKYPRGRVEENKMQQAFYQKMLKKEQA